MKTRDMLLGILVVYSLIMTVWLSTLTNLSIQTSNLSIQTSKNLCALIHALHP